jgi:hypothetical protein
VLDDNGKSLSRFLRFSEMVEAKIREHKRANR